MCIITCIILTTSGDAFSHAQTHSDNLEDALQKLQEILDNAWISVQPIEEDPAKKKKLDKQYVRVYLAKVAAPDAPAPSHCVRTPQKHPQKKGGK